MSAIIAPGLIKTGLWTWYETHKTEITQEFCINKDKPEMECHGKCHLEKELEMYSTNVEIKTKQSERPAPQFDFEDITLFQNSLTSQLSNAPCTMPYTYCFGHNERTQRTCTSIDIPPPEIKLAA